MDAVGMNLKILIICNNGAEKLILESNDICMYAVILCFTQPTAEYYGLPYRYSLFSFCEGHFQWLFLYKKEREN